MLRAGFQDGWTGRSRIWADHCMLMIMNGAHHSAGYLAKFADNAAPKG